MSRQCFLEALPGYIRTNAFSFATPEGLELSIRASETLKDNVTATIIAYPTDRRTPPRLAENINACPRLRYVTECIDVSCIENAATDTNIDVDELLDTVSRQDEALKALGCMHARVNLIHFAGRGVPVSKPGYTQPEVNL